MMYDRTPEASQARSGPPSHVREFKSIISAPGACLFQRGNKNQGQPTLRGVSALYLHNTRDRMRGVPELEALSWVSLGQSRGFQGKGKRRD